MTTVPPTTWTTYTILTAVVGSRAHGLSTDASDVDRCSVFAYNTVDLGALYPPTEQTLNAEDVDHTFHEVGKFCRLALASNPHALELLWVDTYERLTPLGHDLIALRDKFVSAPLVQSAYLGYGRSQIKRLSRPGVASLPNEKRAKLARHVARLLFTGRVLYSTGHLPVAVPDSAEVIQFGVLFASDHDAGVTKARELLAQTANVMDTTRSPLPDTPDGQAVTDFVAGVRSRYLARNTALPESDWHTMSPRPDEDTTGLVGMPPTFRKILDEMKGRKA